MTDFDLTVRAKKGDKDAEFFLFDRYRALIIKEYLFLKRAKPMLTIGEHDYIQDAYFPFREALTYVNIDKITKVSTWKFYQYFKWFLMSKNRKELKTKNLSDISCVFSSLDSTDKYGRELPFEIEDLTITPYDLILSQKQSVKNFESCLSPNERKMYKVLVKKRDSSKKATLKDMCSEIKVSKQRLHQVKQALSNKWKIIIS